MSYNNRKSVTYQLAQAAKAHRQRSAIVLGRLRIYPGQEQVLKALAEQDGQSMTALSIALSVQPPTITKMVARLSAQGLVERHASASDGRAARVHLSPQGRALLADLDAALIEIEEHAMSGMDDRDRKRLRKLLRRMEGNLAGTALPDGDAHVDGAGHLDGGAHLDGAAEPA